MYITGLAALKTDDNVHGINFRSSKGKVRHHMLSCTQVMPKIQAISWRLYSTIHCQGQPPSKLSRKVGCRSTTVSLHGDTHIMGPPQLRTIFLRVLLISRRSPRLADVSTQMPNRWSNTSCRLFCVALVADQGSVGSAHVGLSC